MKYLVTGCAGFIASAVCQELLRRGDEVVGVDDLNDAYDPRLKHWRLARLTGPFTFHQSDVRDRRRMHELVGEGSFDAVLHLAARAGVRQSIEDPWVYLDANGNGTLSLLEACRAHDVSRFLLASTSSLYGAHNPRPFREDADTSRPLSPYAASKMAAESMSASYAHLYGIHVAVPRYFTVYGPAGRPDMSMFRFIRWIAEGDPVTLYGDGTQERDFTFVEDIARGTLLASQKVRGFQVVNLGSDAPVSMNAMISAIETKLDRRANVRHAPPQASDVPATWADIKKARGLGWEPKVSFEEGVARTVEWYLSERAWTRDVDLGGI